MRSERFECVGPTDIDWQRERATVSAEQGLDEHLVYEFFQTFARFEAALKRTSGYLDGNEKHARANWDAFARDIQNKFRVARGTPLWDAVNYLESNPPQKQVVRNKGVGTGRKRRNASRSIALDERGR